MYSGASLSRSRVDDGVNDGDDNDDDKGDDFMVSGNMVNNFMSCCGGSTAVEHLPRDGNAMYSTPS